jgi:hypothetical protein
MSTEPEAPAREPKLPRRPDEDVEEPPVEAPTEPETETETPAP